MKKVATLVSVALLATPIIVGCAPAPVSGGSGGGSQAQLAYYSAQVTAEHMATIDAAYMTRTAAEAAAAAGTATAVVATATAEYAATATSAVATATIQSLDVRGTAQALDALAIVQMGNAQATVEAGSAAVQLEVGLAAAEMTRVAIQNETERVHMERAAMMNRSMPYLLFALSMALVGIVLALAYQVINHSRPHRVGEGYMAYNKGQPVVLVSPPQLPRQATPPPPQLPSGQPSAVATALPPLPSGHVMIVGKSGSGKTTWMSRILASRSGRVVVIDPHAARFKWDDRYEVVGASRDYVSIGEVLEGIDDELDERYSMLARGTSEAQLQAEPVTYAIDELPAIVARLGRDVTKSWAQLIREGRKVGLYAVICSQSLRVETLGITGQGDLREAFNAMIALGDVAQDRYSEMVRGMEYPAVLIDGRGYPRPVVIPGTVASPHTNGHTNGHANGAIVMPPPRGALADPNNMTSQDRQLIEAMHRQNLPLAEIGRRMFGYDGGAGFYAIKQVLGLQ